MDTDIMPKMKQFAQKMDQTINKQLQKLTEDTQLRFENECYYQFSKDHNSYIDCLISNQQKAQNIFAKLEFHFLFLQKSLYNCYSKQVQNNNNDDFCFKTHYELANKIRDDIQQEIKQ